MEQMLIAVARARLRQDQRTATLAGRGENPVYDSDYDSDDDCDDDDDAGTLEQHGEGEDHTCDGTLEQHDEGDAGTLEQHGEGEDHTRGGNLEPLQPHQSTCNLWRDRIDPKCWDAPVRALPATDGDDNTHTEWRERHSPTTTTTTLTRGPGCWDAPMPTCWYVEECPFSHECTKASCFRARPHNWDLEALRRDKRYLVCPECDTPYEPDDKDNDHSVPWHGCCHTCDVELILADEEPAPAHEPLPATVAQAAALPANEYDDTNRVARDLTLVLQLRRRFAEPALSNDDEGIGTLVQLGGRRPAILRLGDQALNDLIRRHVYSRWHCFPQSAMHVS